MKPSDLITKHLAGYTDWRGVLLLHLRKLINETDSNLTEGWKWNVPVWASNGLVCAISGFKDHVKMNFFKGAHISDSHKLFNSGLDSKDHRSINFAQGDKVDETAIADLIREAVAFNANSKDQ